uniref:Zinc finger MYM-type protein 1 n=1 Tax=Cacopsylla melanoneura TaxID=428564 RepID=A0A8D9A6D5_9HEMI
MTSNSVSNLKEIKFSTLSIEEQVRIKQLGRPLPDIHLSQQVPGRNATRQFHRNIYDRNNWICGCEQTNLLFCYPCLLFNSTDVNWTNRGISDLGHLSQKVKRHESSKDHINACINLAVMGTVQITELLSDAYRRDIEQKNAEITKNRYILSKIIDCVKFCGEYELALRGHNESEESENPGIFKGLINFTATLDKIFDDHMKSATVFKGTSKDIQNDLLECMLDVVQETIIQEIKESDYVSIIVDETTDVSRQFQMSIICRYILPTGKPVERFWTFCNPDDHTAPALASTIKTELEKMIGNDNEKLISQSYDGGSVMSGRTNGVQAIIRNDYPRANFVHCYAHQLNLIMEHASSQNSEVRIFFGTLSELTSFFNHSSQRTKELDEIVGKRLSSTCTTRWNFNSRSVLIIHEYKEKIIECLEKISHESLQQTTINQAHGLLLKLEQGTFTFWLTFFSETMPHVDILYNQLQFKSITPDTVNKFVNNFIDEIIQVRKSIDSMDISESAAEHIKRRRINTCVAKNEAAKDICDVIINEAMDRFEYSGHLVLANLLKFENFPVYSKKFPEEDLQTACQCYLFLQKQTLKTELEILYERSDFRTVTKTTDLLGFLKETNLQSCFPELVKVLSIIITIPMTSSEAERSFSCLKRTKTFLRSTMTEERLNSLAMLSMEKGLIQKMSANFNDLVIEKFAAKKERRMDFQFKVATTKH